MKKSFMCILGFHDNIYLHETYKYKDIKSWYGKYMIDNKISNRYNVFVCKKCGKVKHELIEQMSI